MSAIIVQGMHGLGDNLHQRAIVRELMTRYADVLLESSWVSVYHDLVAAGGLKIIRVPTPLRLQRANADREDRLFYKGPLPAKAQTICVTYWPHDVRACGSVLGAMCRATGCDYEGADFSLPIPAAWDKAALDLLERLSPDRPIMLFRPLVERKEWGGCRARNPDHQTYAALFEAIAERFFVISIADVQEPEERIVGIPVRADVVFHKRELNFEVLAALTARASLVFCSPGFAVPLAQAVGTPVACIFGGYERAYSFAGGARTSAYLGIEPIRGCDCFRHDHACSKEIDFANARTKLLAFAEIAASRAIAA